MRALTIRQPWASAILLAGKNIENRTWATRYRGPLLIHAGSRNFSEFDPWDWMESRFDLPDGLRSNACVRGAILGLVDLVDCVRDNSSPWALPNHWHWEFSAPSIFPAPIPVPGRLGLWNFPASELPGLVQRSYSARYVEQTLAH